MVAQINLLKQGGSGRTVIFAPAGGGVHVVEESGETYGLTKTIVGEIVLFLGSSAPADCMVCEGQLLPKADYPLLFTAIGTQYGGDGVTTFALPDYRYSNPKRCIRVDPGVTTIAQVVVIGSIVGPAPGYYKAGTLLSFTVQLLDDIVLSGSPQLVVTIGGIDQVLSMSGSASNAWYYEYTVLPGENGEVTAAIDLTGVSATVDGISALLNISSNVSDATVDTVAPTITLSALAFSSDTGSSATDFITNVATQTITATLSGALSATEQVHGSLDNGATWIDITGYVYGNALSWEGVTLSGSDTLKLKVVDLAGNDGPILSQAYVIDTTAPATPTVDALTTSNTTPTISGTATVSQGEALTVSVNAISYTVGDGNLSLSGTVWSLTIPAGNALPVGTYNVAATVTDAAGNSSTDTTNNELTITV